MASSAAIYTLIIPALVQIPLFGMFEAGSAVDFVRVFRYHPHTKTNFAPEPKRSGKKSTMNKLVAFAAIIIAIGVAGWYFFGPGSDMSGTYIGKNASQAFLLQLVQNSGGQLSGFYEEAGLTADGTVDQDNIPLTGQRDGKTFTVTLIPTGLAHFFTGDISLFGNYTGQTIALIGESGTFNANLNLAKGDAATYQTYIAGLNAQAAAIQNEKAVAAAQAQQIAAQQAIAQQQAAAAQDLESRLQADLRLIASVQATVATRISQLNDAAEKLQAETAKMQNALNREDAMGGYQTAEESQISGAIVNANDHEQNIMNEIQGHLENVEQTGLPVLLQKIKEHDVTCQGLNATSTTRVSFTGPEAELDDCIKVENATPGLSNEVSQLLAAYQNLFSTWQVENQKRQEIIVQSQL